VGEPAGIRLVVRGEFLLDSCEPLVEQRPADVRSAPETTHDSALHCAITRSGTEMMNNGAPHHWESTDALEQAGMTFMKSFSSLGGKR